MVLCTLAVGLMASGDAFAWRGGGSVHFSNKGYARSSYRSSYKSSYKSSYGYSHRSSYRSSHPALSGTPWGKTAVPRGGYGSIKQANKQLTGARRNYAYHNYAERGSAKAYYQKGYKAGSLPAGYSQLRVGRTDYYFHGGTYYKRSGTGYQVTSAPVGAVHRTKPAAATTVTAKGNSYYYKGGAYYAKRKDGYAVVSAPLGATVTQLPAGAQVTTVNGLRYYAAGSTYYRPVMRSGEMVYTVVPKPKAQPGGRPPQGLSLP